MPPMGRVAEAFDPHARLQTKAGICVYLGHISGATYDAWCAKGLVPGPVRGTNRYDVRAHDLLLDRHAGLMKASRTLSPLEQWEAENARALLRVFSSRSKSSRTVRARPIIICADRAL